jgi:hypothetical protein
MAIGRGYPVRGIEANEALKTPVRALTKPKWYQCSDKRSDGFGIDASAVY